MKVDRVVRTVLALLVVLLLFALLAALLFVTEAGLNIWARLGAEAPWLRYAFAGALLSALLLCIWIVWRFVVPRKANKPSAEPLDEARIGEKIDQARAGGTDVSAANAELEELARRRDSNTVHVCVFGEISAGKSTLIKALLPGADVDVSPVGGSTERIRHYTWRDAGGGQVLLTDVPGTGSAGEPLDDYAREEALRAHVVLYVCEGDLSRHQLDDLRELHQLGKPTVVVLNKSDRYGEDELAVLRQRLQDRVGELADTGLRTAVVVVSAGGDEDVVREMSDGSQQRVLRKRAPQLDTLRLAIQEMLARDPALITSLRDQSVFRLAEEKLVQAQDSYRRERSATLVRGYTKKAVIGALAAISPGSDIVIQGYLGTAMTRDLCALWGVAVRDMEIEAFLDMTQSRVGKALPLSLAVAGNGLKAFPGVGTIAGGLVHAVAYGLIFDALGRSLADTLSKRGALEPETAVAEFEGTLSEHMEKGVRRVAQLALSDRTRDLD